MIKYFKLRLVLGILILFPFTADLSGQVDTSKSKNDTLPGRSYLLQEVERAGVVMPEVEIKEVTVVARHGRAGRNEYHKYERLIHNVKKVYPYALIVRKKLDEVNSELKNITDEKEQKRYLKNLEKNLLAQYEDDMKHMTLTQGKLLIKLIDRETQNTSFDLIRDYRGKFSAAFWQGIARIFGTSLKAEYDRYGDDALIEYIILEIDAGRL